MQYQPSFKTIATAVRFVALCTVLLSEIAYARSWGPPSHRSTSELFTGRTKNTPQGHKTSAIDGVELSAIVKVKPFGNPEDNFFASSIQYQVINHSNTPILLLNRQGQMVKTSIGSYVPSIHEDADLKSWGTGRPLAVTSEIDEVLPETIHSDKRQRITRYSKVPYGISLDFSLTYVMVPGITKVGPGEVFSEEISLASQADRKTSKSVFFKNTSSTSKSETEFCIAFMRPEDNQKGSPLRLGEKALLFEATADVTKHFFDPNLFPHLCAQLDS